MNVGAPDTPEPVADEEAFRDIVVKLLDEAIREKEHNISPTVVRNWETYHGKVDAKPTDGGSDIVASAAADTVSTLLPDILDCLISSDAVVEFIPPSIKLAPLCEAATTAAIRLFWTCGGYAAVNDSLMDAAVGGRSGGWIKLHVKQRRKLKKQRLSYVSESDRLAIRAIEDQKLIDLPNGEVEHRIYSLDKKFDFCAVPANDMIYTADTSADDCYLIGQRTDCRLGDLVRYGFDVDKLQDIGRETESRFKAEKDARNSATSKEPDANSNWALKPVTVFELYPMIDVDGDGVPERYRVFLAGSSRKLLSWEEVEDQPFVQIPLIRIPHSMYCAGTVEKNKPHQEAETILLRALMDNAGLLNDPMILAPELAVNHDALANWRRLKVVPANAPDAVKWFTPPDATAGTLAAKQAVEGAREESVGIGRSAMGLDANSLASVPEVAVMQAMTAAQRKLLFYVRTIAEFGFKSAFSKILRLMVSNPEIVKATPLPEVAGLDVRDFDTSWGVRVRVGLGTASEAQRERVYQKLYDTAREMLGAPAPFNTATDATRVMALLRDWLRGYPSIPSDRYFDTPEQMAAKIEQMAQQQGRPEPPPDPAMMKVQGELQIKGKQVDAEIARKDAEARANIGRKDRELELETSLEAQSIAIGRSQDINIRRPQ